MRLCSRAGCIAPAAWRVTVEVPAESDLARKHPLQMSMVGVQLCAPCGLALEVAEIVTPAMKGTLTRRMLAEGKDAPDWDRARVVLVPVGLGDSPVVKAALRLDRERRMGGA